MKAKTKTPKLKFGPPTLYFLCFLCFLAGFLLSALLFQDMSGVRSHSRILESVQENDLAMPHGETGESFVRGIPFQVLSWKPRAVYFPGFASAEQCQNIIARAKSELEPSSLAFRKGDTEENTKGTRTSSGTFLRASEDKTGTVASVEEKIARATMLPRSNGEPFNVLRYQIGQKYDCHYDSFDPEEYGPQSNQRIASFLLYLSDVEKGGETMFPLENGAEMTEGFDFEKCTGLKVKPRRGDGLLFYSLLPNSTIDELSLHGSCPVIKGEKWVATKWIRV
ncbi:hypothetical protein UlMin_031093 [Ulmus minor]